MLEISNLSAGVDGKEILKGLNLTVKAGEVHAIMGPNGSGKSTLAGVLAGRSDYTVSGGSVSFNGVDLLEMKPEERARAGLFLAFQYPVEIPGVNSTVFLKAALNECRKARGEEELDAVEFLHLVKQKTKILDLDQTLLSRPVNEGFSGGEKKRNEIFQMALLEPKLSILDETDSGLDIDALKVVSSGVNKLRRPDNATIVITHYQRLLDYIVPDVVHVLVNGQIVKTGDKELAKELEKRGYDWIIDEVAKREAPEQWEAVMDNLTKAFEGVSASGPEWLRTRRESARAKMAELGFPTTRHEEWRFTNIAPLLQLPLHPAAANGHHVTAKDIQPFCVEGAQALVFVDGIFRPDLSSATQGYGSLQLHLAGNNSVLEKHLTRHADFEASFFTALNTAYFSDGAFISLPAKTTGKQPVQLLFVAATDRPGAMVQARNLIVVEEGSELKIIESYASLGTQPHVTNSVTELVLGPEARIEHCLLQNENAGAFHIATIQAVLNRGSHWTSHSIATGGQVARYQIQALLQDEGAEAVLNGLFMAQGDQLIDHHTVVDHAAPRCESHEFYHGVLTDRSHGVFNGKIFVRPRAQKTNAKQTNRNLVLSENAVIDTKPQLEIYADDVKCTHGATVGQLNDEALFYLRSRGIGAVEARRMLIRAFAADVVERISIEPVRQRLEQILTNRFQNVEG